jgi:hypothetical protein
MAIHSRPIVGDTRSPQNATYCAKPVVCKSSRVPFFTPSHIERCHLTVRMSLRWFTRLTNGHSKSLRHHTAMQALFVAWYNFARKNEALKNQTPAMAIGLSDHVWTVKELIEKAAE